MDVKVINPLIKAVDSTVQQMLGISTTTGKMSLIASPVSEMSICIMVGITGAVRGQAIISMSTNTALTISSTMLCGMGTGELDDLAKSALQELGNISLGTYATLLSSEEILVDITPPSLIQADNITLSTTGRAVKIPLESSLGTIDITLLIKE